MSRRHVTLALGLSALFIAACLLLNVDAFAQGVPPSSSSVSVSAPITGAGTSGSPLTCSAATAAAAGCVSTSAQAMAGYKHLPNGLGVGAVDAGHVVMQGQLKVVAGATSAVQLVNGEGVNFSTADNDAYIIRSAANTLRIGNGTASALSLGVITLGAPAGTASSIANTRNNGTVTLVSGTPSTATATVFGGAICVCAPVGTTAAVAAAGCAVSLSGSTLTITGPDSVTTSVNYHCF